MGGKEWRTGLMISEEVDATTVLPFKGIAGTIPASRLLVLSRVKWKAFGVARWEFER